MSWIKIEESNINALIIGVKVSKSDSPLKEDIFEISEKIGDEEYELTGSGSTIVRKSRLIEDWYYKLKEIGDDLLSDLLGDIPSDIENKD